jgi:hypothetical protein
VPAFLQPSLRLGQTTSAEECKNAETCTIRGTVTVVVSDGVEMGEIRSADGKCVTLSLSSNDIRYLRRAGPVEATVSGKIYRGHHDPSSILLKIGGRKVGYPRCGEFYLFVP